MNIIFYLVIFIIGTLFGSFYTLAVYRIPKREDITHTHSYCPNCSHKLGLFDLIPILSYIFLRGRCRYCKQKIRPRYIVLEILSGALFLIMALVMGLNIENLTLIKVLDYCFVVLYLTFIILMAGIDKENRKIDKVVSIYGIVISIMYMIYLCIVEKQSSIYRYVILSIYLCLYIVILILDTITLKKFAKNTYINGILLTIITMVIFTQEYITANTLIVTILSIAIYLLIYKIANLKNRHKKTDKQISDEIQIGFCLGVSNVLIFIFAIYFMTKMLY